MHRASEPSILYFGTPVILISSVNDNGTFNIAPFSSAFWLGWRCVIGIAKSSKTFSNMVRTKECVINLPSIHEVAGVNKLALLTGSNPVPDGKQRKGYTFESDKFGVAGFTTMTSEAVSVASIKECPVHLEAFVTSIHSLADDDVVLKNRIAIVDLRIVKVRLSDDILMPHDPNRVDPDAWKPLMMSFQQFYGFGERVHESKLASIPERAYAGGGGKVES